jgi:acrylyl-CoA reductase (NADPH)/3-hydroxypropionyl-CoA dehydratase/3-hydroxypropionyl-CoA synthetase
MMIATESLAPPRAPRSNPIRTRADWEAQRAAFLADPGAFHGAIARGAIHWYDAALAAWITWDAETQRWHGVRADDGRPVAVDYPAEYQPWQTTLDSSTPPFYRWFSGGLTNACFNEVDRHVLAGFGDEIAYYFEGDRWDNSLNGGRGGPVVHEPITRKQLLLEVVKATLVLKSLGLQQGDRIALNMPNILPQIFYTEAAKRLGIVYTPVFGGFSDKTLSDRIHNAGARIVLTSDGGYRNAQVVPYKEIYTDQALDKFVPVETCYAIVEQTLGAMPDLPQAARDLVINQVRAAIKDDITVERTDVMRGVGLALSQLSHLDAATQAEIRTSIAQALVNTPPRVEAVVVVRHTGQEIVWRKERDVWSHELVATATQAIYAAAQAHGHAITSDAELLALPVHDLYAILAGLAPCTPLDAEYPMFIIYTSGSTGKPKGVVHVHGGYVAGLAHTMKVSFDAEPGDTIFVVADPGWITGQSYMITATLASRCTGILIEGSPVFPSAGRYASIIERHNVQIFKAGVTFLKAVMTDPQNVADVQQYDMGSLRVCTFCAEPVSPAVQQFGMEIMSPQYINSYWATEHGGIVWTHFYGNDDYPLRPDAHTYPLPWVVGDVWVQASGEQRAESGERSVENVPAQATDSSPLSVLSSSYRVAEYEEKGEIVITAPYPYLTRTIWGDVEGFEKAVRAGETGEATSHDSGSSPLSALRSWKGDAERFVKTYWKRGPNGEWAYVQGDFAMKYPDASFTLHGRSDDVINVSGHRMGTEEIEGAILRDKTVTPDSPVGNCIVVGAPHREKGLTPVAFILTIGGRKLTSLDRRRLDETVRAEKGIVAVPEDYIEVAAFPETRSGKYMRRFLRSLMLDEPLGDTTTLRNPESLDEIRVKIAEWKRKQQAADEQQIFERYRYFRIEYHPLGGTKNREPKNQIAKLALVTITNPPVNALNERSLDELNTIVDHLARRKDVAAVIFTGQGTKSFVAGADIRQLLEETHSVEDALALPNNAHLAFRKIELMDKPCIAAINGVALGGGMEFALACHYRVADIHAEFGQPEINLRLLPGYGGTQRLPRLLYRRTNGTGLLRSLELILGGRTLNAQEAHEIGLIEALADDGRDAVSVASALAREFVLGNSERSEGPPLLSEIYAARQKRNVASLEPQPDFVEDVLTAIIANPRIQRIVAQAKWAGRAKAVERALDAIRHGYTYGLEAGLQREARLFAEAIVDPEGGKKGIQDFVDKKSAPLPTRKPLITAEQERMALERGDLLPVGAPFFPGVTRIPTLQYGMGTLRDPEKGGPIHGDPINVERQFIIPVEQPRANQALVYVLASEVNFNDIWAITGIPVSQFDNHDRDYHVTGSGGIGIIAALGEEARRQGRLKVGDIVTIFSGQSDLLAPTQGLDPMFADFFIQGNETPDGSHQQFMIAQAPQLLPTPPDLSIEAAGSYVLSMGTVYRALFTCLNMQGGRNIFIEGAATGTGYDAVRIAARNGLRVTGMVSSADRAATVKAAGAQAAINRKNPHYSGIFTRVPADPAQWAAWEQAGAPLLEDARAENHGHLMDYVVSHAGEAAFPRSFQLLGEPRGGHIPTLTFYGASSGYHFTFMGKPGAADPIEMLRRVNMRAGEAVVIYYGIDRTSLVDQVGLEGIEAARTMGGRIVIVTYTDAQREFVQSLGFGAALKGVLSLEELQRRMGDDFQWPATMPELPDAKHETAAFKEAVRQFQEYTFKPIGSALGPLLRTADNPRGAPDIVIERAGHDTLAASTMLIKPFTGRVVYYENMGGRRYSFYAPQVWTRHRRIYMPSANIWGTHLSNAYEVTRLNDEIGAGILSVSEPVVVAWDELPAAHQAMWENRLAGATYVVNHALPRPGIKSKDELYEAWAQQR